MESTTQVSAKQDWNEAAAASALAQAEAAHPPSRYTELLPVKLTEKELADRAKKAASYRAQITDFETAKKAAADHWKAKIELAENERDNLLDAIADGVEDREVEVVESFDFRRGEVTVIRADTGEKIKERAMTSAERQPSLPGTDEAVSPRVVDAEEPSDDDGTAITAPQETLDGASDADGADTASNANGTKVVRRRKRSES